MSSAVIEAREQIKLVPAKLSTWARIWPFLLVMAAASVMFFADLGSYPLFNPDEALYAEPAREMLETGEYITTLLNYVVRFTKPPLAIWAMAASYVAFGVNEFAARLPGALCGLLLVTATYWFAEKYCGRLPAFFAALSLCTAPLFVGTAREAITDMPLSLFMAGALFAFFHAFHQRHHAYKWLGYVLVGLAVMTKGPVGLVLPVAIVGAYHLIRGEVLDAWRFYRPLWGLAIVALIAVPWFAVEIWITNGAYFNEFIIRENFQRFTGVVDHKYGWWYHLAAVMGGYFPWSIWLPQALVLAAFPTVHSVRSVMKQHQNQTLLSSLQAAQLAARSAPLQDSAKLFAICCTGIVVGFFSVSVSKLIPYTVPAFPFIALLVGCEFQRIVFERRVKPLLVPLGILGIAFACGGMIAPIAVQRLREAPPDLATMIQSLLVGMLAGVLVGVVFAVRKKPMAALAAFATTVFVCSAYYGSQALGILAREWEMPLPNLARYAALTDWPLHVYSMRKPSVPFYLLRQVVIPHNDEEMLNKLNEAPNAYVLTKTKNEQFFVDHPGFETVAKEGRFMLVWWNRDRATSAAGEKN